MASAHSWPVARPRSLVCAAAACPGDPVADLAADVARYRDGPQLLDAIVVLSVFDPTYQSRFDLPRALHEARLGVGFEPIEETGKGVVRGGEGVLGLHARGLGTTDRPWGGDQKIDVVFGGRAWWVHIGIIDHVYAPIN